MTVHRKTCHNLVLSGCPTHALHDDVIGVSLTRSVLYLYTLTFAYIVNYAIAEFAFKCITGTMNNDVKTLAAAASVKRGSVPL